jgi:quercetin dioxygenase-like cupin family protein
LTVGGGAFKTQAERVYEGSERGPAAMVTGPGDGLSSIVTVDAAFEAGQAHAFHRHPNQEEVIYVLEGRIEQWIEQDRLVLGPGDAVAIGKGVVHATFNDGSERARILAILSPSRGDSGYEVEEVADQAPWSGLR